MTKFFTKTLGILCMLLSLQVIMPAQEQEETREPLVSINTGLDIVSSYIWRSIDYGNSPAIQPYVALSIGNFEFTAWGSYALIAQQEVETKTISEVEPFEEVTSTKNVPFTEIDLIARYDIETSIGTFSPEVTDFYYPYLNQRYSDFKGDGEGQHWVNVALKYCGTEKFPIMLTLDYAAHNDVDKPVYFEAGYPFSIGESEISVFAGVGKGKEKSDLYGLENDKVGFVNAGISFARQIKIANDFSLPVSTSFMMNPNASKAFLVFKISL